MPCRILNHNWWTLPHDIHPLDQSKVFFLLLLNSIDLCVLSLNLNKVILQP